jgi:NAD(P)-dependent dehydrogenase (short-subunit alcohol dehydrogenase family)
MLTINLTDKRALVSGVTSGIGAGIAQQLARAGCDVAGCGRRGPDSDGAREFVRLVEAEGRRAHYAAVDVADAEAVRAWPAQAAAALGGIDIVVSNAGRNVFTGVEASTDADWDECMALDLAAHWRLAQAAKPWLETGRDPAIVVITSNHAYYTIKGCFPYNVAKAGLVAMVQAMALDWGPRIRAVGLAPGFVATAGGDAWFESFPDPKAKLAEVEAMHPVGRLGTVEEMGAIVAFLASPLAGFISGTTLLADGGRGAVMQD